MAFAGMPTGPNRYNNIAKGAKKAASKLGPKMRAQGVQVTDKQVERYLRAQGVKMSQKSPEDFLKWSKGFLSKGLLDATFKLAQGYVLTKVAEKLNTSTGTVESDGPDSAISMKTSSSIAKDNGLGLTAKRYKVTLNTGNKASKSVSTFMRNAGSNKLCLLDTSRDTQFVGAGFGDRENFQLRGGFNQKLIYASDYAQTSVLSVSSLYNLGREQEPSKIDPSKEQTAYGIARDLQEQLHFHNLNTYHAVDLKIHLVASLQAKGSTDYNSTTTKSTIKEITGTIGDFDYEYTNYLSDKFILEPADQYPEKDGGKDPNRNTASACFIDPRASIRSSKAFNNAHVIIQTVSKRLAPGDRLDFKNNIGLGSGLNLNDLYNRIRNFEDQFGQGESLHQLPLAYQYIIEVVGQKTVGVDQSGDTFLGTAPFTIQMEAMQKIVMGINTVVSSATPGTGGYSDDKWAIKLYTRVSDNRSVEKLKYSTYWNPTISTRTVSNAVQVIAGPITD